MTSTPLELHIHRCRCPNAGPWSADSLGPGTLGDCVNLGPMLSELFGCVHELRHYLEKKLTSEHNMHKNIEYIRIYPSWKVIILLVYYPPRYVSQQKSLPDQPACCL